MGQSNDNNTSDNGHGSENWSDVMGGCDPQGNPITVQFGYGPHEGETRLGDGDRSEGGYKDALGNVHTGSFQKSDNHDHYGSGNGPNGNGTTRGQYTGPGH